MTTIDSIVQDIIDNPEALDLRLIAADLHEEQGEYDRAEFIRLQCAMWQAMEGCSCGKCVKRRHGGGQHTNGPCAGDQLRWNGKPARLRELELQAPGRHLWPYYGPGITVFIQEWRRGFPESLMIHPEHFQNDGLAASMITPITEVHLVEKCPLRITGKNFQFCWTERNAENAFPSMVPDFLFNLLPQKEDRQWTEKSLSRRRWYLSEGEALKALSDACVAWLRQERALRGRLQTD